MFPEGRGFVNITVPEGGPTATGMNPEGGTAKNKLPSTPHRLINGTALSKQPPIDQFHCTQKSQLRFNGLMAKHL